MGFKEDPVRVGSMLYTQVDPEPGYEVDYNRWYERDHFYAGCMIGPWLFAGRRWVATRDLKDLRFPDDTPFVPKVRDGSYVAIYWIHEDHYDDHVEWATEHKLRTFAFTGYDGGKLKKMSQTSIHVDSWNMGMLESVHLVVFHYLLDTLRDAFKKLALPA